MEPVAPSDAVVSVLLAIARAGFAYTATKALCAAAGWRLADDEFDLGYVRYDIAMATTDAYNFRPLSVLITENSDTPCACLPLCYFDENEESRDPFDRAFGFAAEKLAGFLDGATRSGIYCYPHRDHWLYKFIGWCLPDATLLLVQDEYDIQFGMDLTLWIQPAGTAVEAPVVVW